MRAPDSAALMNSRPGLRLLVLTRYSRLGASSRLRTFQFDGYLRDAGIEPTYSSFFDDAYLERFYGGGVRAQGLRNYLARRVRMLRRAGHYDCIWLEKEALPWIPFALEHALWPREVPVVTDFDDAVFHRYDSHPNPLVRLALGRKIDRIMAASRLVFAGNTYLADRARAAGAAVEIVPTVVSLARYRPRDPLAIDGPLRIGWIGTPSTWQDYLADVAPEIVAASEACGATFCAVGGGEPASRTRGVQVVEWTEASEVDLIRSMDIGIMPLTDSPFARGKCGYKLIQYMACGLPVVASPVGVNAEIVEHGVNGFLASSSAEWREAIVRLAGDRELRLRMGTAGRQKVVSQFSAEAVGPRIARLLKATVEQARQ